jgi:TonB-linked SusC/RagA family outer membrane protein
MRFTITQNRPKPKRLLLLLFVLLIHLQAMAQQQTLQISGKVTDEKGETLPGVTVRLKNSKVGSVTDMNGKYTITADSRGTLQFSYLGFVTQEIAVNGLTQINVTLVGEPKSLNEVVVIGYGTQKRENVTDAITTIKASEFNNGNINDPLTLIEGKVAGLSISQSGGSDPNAQADFQLRGPSSVFGNTSPLLVIDGVPGGDLQMIAPSDIASIDVLKDASASAIYGSRANGGVIIVTTKKGKAGTTTITYDGNLSTDVIAKKYKLLDAQQYIALGTQYKKTIDDRKANTNWFNEVTRRPVSNSHNLAINGGTDKTTYYASVAYKNLQGVDLVDNRRFVEGHARLSTKAMNDKLNFTVELTNSFDNKNYANTGAIAQTLNMNPTYPVRNPDGTFFENPNIPYHLEWNPVASELLHTNNNIEKRLQGTADLSYTIVSTLKANVTYNTRHEDYLNSQYAANNDFFEQLNGTNGTASRNEYNIVDNVVEGTLTYNKQIKKHSFDFVAGYSYQNNFTDGFTAQNNNFESNATLYYNLGAGTGLNDFNPNHARSVRTESAAGEDKLESVFGRVIYNYDEKYLFKASLRRDGSSKLADGNKFQNFYGISAGWVLSKEEFLQNSNVFKFLKLRGSFGTTGNEQALSAYQSLYLLDRLRTGDAEGLNFPQDGYIGDGVNGAFLPSYGPTNNTNAKLRWEIQKEADLGLDFSLFNESWLTGSLDVYKKRVDNLLGNFTAQVPSNIFPYISANAGSFEDKGIELALNARLFKTKNFSWNVSFTAAYNTNKVISLSSDQFFSSAQQYGSLDGNNFVYRLAPGQPVSEFYGRVFSGFATDGTWLFKNAAGKAVPESELDPATDYKYLGNGLPTTNLSLTNSFRIGHFDASILLKSALGFKAVNAKRLIHENLGQFNQSNLFTTVTNSNNLVKDAQLFSSYYVEKGDYMKISNLNLGYSVPMKQNSAVKSLRLSLIAQNLLTVTGFSGGNPELPLSATISGDAGLSNPGLEPLYNYYPATITLSFGVSATF